MSIKQEVLEAAAAGHKEREANEQAAAFRRAEEERLRAGELQVLTDAAKVALRGLASEVKKAARIDKASCTAHIIPPIDLEIPRGYKYGDLLDVSMLRGVSRRVFEILQEQELEPIFAATQNRVFFISIPVPRKADEERPL